MILGFSGDVVTLTVLGDIMGAGWDPSPFGWGTTTAVSQGRLCSV